jgi:pimeloyl-ACP methyl ester carboxylesterase
MRFEHNEGQTDKQVEFLARGGGYSLFLTSTEAVLALSEHAQAIHQESMVEQKAGPRGANPIQSAKQIAARGSLRDVLRIGLVGANPAAKIEGFDELPGRSNYFIGNDVAEWRTNVAQYTHIHYKDVYPGVELIYYGNQGQLEYDFVVAPGADPKSLILSVKGARRIHIDARGALVLETARGKIVQHQPIVYQEINGERKEITGRYVIKDRREVGFDIAEYDLRQTLVIDPVLSYSTYLGGSGDDAGNAIAVDSAGNAYITGQTSSINFPTLNASQPSYGSGGVDAFVTKLTATGGLSYSTYLGGSGGDEALGIAVDSAGSAYLAGLTASTNFPTLNALQGSNGGGFADAFVTKLTATGALSYSTYLGGNSSEGAFSIAVDAAGNAYVTGDTQSTNFPTLNAYQGSHASDANNPDVFVTKLMSNGALGYSTYLGGGDSDIGWSIAVDATSNAYVTGDTLSTNFPTANAFQVHKNGGMDVFLTKLTAGGGLSYSTYLGGNSDDIGKGIAIDSASNLYLTGQTFSTNFPTTLKPYQEAHAIDNGRSDVFVTKLTASGSLSYSTYLGGNMTDSGAGIAVDPGGNAYVTGSTESTDFPPLDAFQSTHVSGFTSAFVAKLTATGGLSYSTYLGGNSNDQGLGIGVDSVGNAYVTGSTRSTNFPPMKAVQANNGGGIDAFVTKLTVSRKPILFIPGLMGSSLTNAGSDTRAEAWPGGACGIFADHSALTLDPAKIQLNLIPDKAISSVCSHHYYDSLLAFLSGQGYREYVVDSNHQERRTTAGCDLSQSSQNPNLFVFAYDWRLGNAENAAKLKDYVGCIRRFYANSKIDVLTHSMGGLLVRRYILDNPTDHSIDKLITIAAPWLGAPASIQIMHTGDAGFHSLFIMKTTLRGLAEFFPSAHQLLPSRSYFSFAQRPYVKDGLALNYDQFVETFNSEYPRSLPGNAGKDFHDRSGQDDWRTDQSSVQYYHIYGQRKSADTIGTFYSTLVATHGLLGWKTQRVFRAELTIGDKTVPTLSASRVGIDSGLNLNAPTASLKLFSNNEAVRDDLFEHTALTQNPDVQNYIGSILSGTGTAQVQREKAEALSDIAPAYYLREMGAASLTVTDSVGNTTNPLSDLSDAGIPNVTTAAMGDKAALIIFPTDQTYAITLKADSNPISLEITKGTNSLTSDAIRYQDLGLPPGVTALLRITAQGVEALRYDRDGDGIFESTVVPTAAVTGAAAQDTNPPSVSIDATRQASMAVVTITSSDSGSGVRSTYYSTDGINFQPYSGPLTVNQYQAPAIYAFADDNVGNRSGLVIYRLINPGVPVLVSEANSTRAVALDSVLWLREPFKLSYGFPWGSDQRTRIMLFALNFDLSPGESASSVAATAQDGSNQVYSLPVEFVGKVPGAEWLTCVVVKLNDNIGDVGDVLVQISYHGINSNRVRVGIGHIGGGPPDNATSLPASRPRP